MKIYDVGQNDKCAWDDTRQRLNLADKGYDFADAEAVFDGRFCLTRQDTRKDYGETRYNTLAEFRERVVNITFTPRAGRIHLISVRPAGREERQVCHARSAQV